MKTVLTDRVRERADSIREPKRRPRDRDVEPWLQPEQGLEGPVDRPAKSLANASVEALDRDDENPASESDTRSDEGSEPRIERPES